MELEMREGEKLEPGGETQGRTVPSRGAKLLECAVEERIRGSNVTRTFRFRGLSLEQGNMCIYIGFIRIFSRKRTIT